MRNGSIKTGTGLIGRSRCPPVPTGYLCVPGTLVAAAFVVGLTACQPGPLDLPEIASVALAVTPGKPNAPTETVTLSRRGSDVHLRVERTNGERVIASATAALPLRDFETVWRLVQQRDLTTFVPETVDRAVYDFGERVLRIEWQVERAVSDHAARTTDHRVAWTAPLASPRRIEALFHALEQLAARHAGDVALAYFRSNPD